MSVRQPPSRPEVDGDPAREGTCAAWVAEMVINWHVANAQAMLGHQHENGWVVDEEMVRHVEWYVDVVFQNGRHPVAEVFMQHASGLAGTADTLHYDQDRNFLFIWDLKYGYGIVPTRNNWQLLCYLWLWVASNNIYPDMVQLAICQPRPLHQDGPYRKWVLSRAEYEPLLGQISKRVTELISGQDVRAVPGDHCQDCALAVGCDALTQSVYQLMDRVVESRTYRDPDGQQLADELSVLGKFKTLFEARFSAVSAETEARISEGGFVPGYVLEKHFGKKKFTVSNASIQMLTGIDPTEKKTCTPAELIRRGADKEVVDGITTKPFIGAKLVKVDGEAAMAKINTLKEKANG